MLTGPDRNDLDPPSAPALPPMRTPEEQEEIHKRYEAQQKIVEENMAEYAGICRQKEMQFQIVGAIEKEDAVLVRSLIAEGVNVNAAILFTRTPLVHAIEDGHEEISIILIQGGAEVHSTEKTFPYRSPVHIAALNGFVMALQELYNHGADINVEEATAMKPIHFAAWRGHVGAINWLLQHDADPDSRDDFLRTPLHRAVEGNHHTIVKLLISKGADINSKDRFKWTALFHCVMCDNTEMVKLLLELGIESNTISNTGNTPLHAACARLRPILTRILLSAAPDPVRRNRRIPFPDFEEQLNAGEFSSHFEIAEALVDSGADVNAKNNESFTPLYLALFFGQNVKLVDFLCTAGSWLSEESWLSQELYRQVADEKGFRETLRCLDATRGQPPSLINQSRTGIRRVLARNIKLKIHSLPVPTKIKNYLNLDEFYEKFSSD